MFSSIDEIKVYIKYQIQLLQKFYKDEFDIIVDFSKVIVPKHQQGFDRLMMVAKGVGVVQASNITENTFSVVAPSGCCIHTFCDTECRKADKASYAFWVRDEIETDDAYIGKSVNVLTKSINGITMTELLLLGLFRYNEDKTLIDSSTVTICSGSRDDKGFVSALCHVAIKFEGKHGLRLNMWNTTDSSKDAGIREVIAL
jgi:hypothetical protein